MILSERKVFTADGGIVPICQNAESRVKRRIRTKKNIFILPIFLILVGIILFFVVYSAIIIAFSPLR